MAKSGHSLKLTEHECHEVAELVTGQSAWGSSAEMFC